MVDIHHEGVCDAPVTSAFAYIDDYRNVRDWMFGLAKFDPRAGAPSQGLGSIFEAKFAVKPISLASTIEITEWVENELIAFRSIEGFKNHSTWRLRENGDGRTTITVVFSYELPGGIAGKVMGRAFEPVVALSVRHSDESLRRNIEAFHREQSA